MALRYAGAIWDPLGTQTEPRMRAHDVAVLHTMAGTFSGVDRMFHESGYGGLESHFGLAGSGLMDQWQDIAFEADANLDGNDRVISLETADRGETFPPWSGSDVPAWTQPQVEAIVKWLLWVTSKEAHAACPPSWLCHQVGIPRVLIPDTQPHRRGIGYHRQGIDPWRHPNGERWSNATGKVCPGDRRIEQLVNVIIPRVQGVPQEDDDMAMSAEDREWFIYVLGWLTTGKVNSVVNPKVPEWAFADDATTFTLPEIATRVPGPDAIAAAVVAKLPAGSVDVAAVGAEFRRVLAEVTTVGHLELATEE